MWIISFFLALILLIIVQRAVYTRMGFRRLSYRRAFTPPTVNEGESVTMVETIGNNKLLPLPWVRVEAQISPNLIFAGSRRPERTERHFHRSIFAMPPYMRITRRHRVECPRRGYYHIKSVAITAGDLFGVGPNVARDYPTDSIVTVYPSLVPIDDIFNDKNSYTGDTVVRRWIVEDPFMIKGVREYTASDPFNHINWKATAKTGTLQVHNFDFTAKIQLVIIVNIDTSPHQWTVTQDEACAERALSIAASCAQYAIEHGIKTGFITNGRAIDDPDTVVHIDPQIGEEHLTTIFEAISKTLLNRTLTFPTLLRQEVTSGIENCDILIISAYTDDSIEEQIAALRAGGNTIEVIRPERTIGGGI